MVFTDVIASQQKASCTVIVIKTEVGLHVHKIEMLGAYSRPKFWSDQDSVACYMFVQLQSKC